ncbi:MAG: acyl-ACP--UDP-N-acetylglucosamine O-acyltransferase [Gammaproteobacteria bacterium]|nr:acyl-ACP--UDP-N-acetylglucosamine O-acyltransferase [Gammaproteobacteria bacterium]
MIDPRAIVDPAARLAPDVSVGPFAIIGPDVEIGAGTTIGPHAVVKGPTRIGRNNRIYQFASIGEAPQDKKYAGEPTRLEIGDDNLFREYVTVHRGTVQGGGITRIGDHNWIMIGCHIAHDCIVGSHTIFSNNAALAGHVVVDDYAILGGYTLVHQFCAIGAHCFTAMGSVISKDVPPYVLVSGHMAKPYGLNVEGLKRRGFSAETISDLRRAYKLLYKSRLTLEQAVGEIRALAQTTPEAGALVAFIEASTRGVIR